MTGIAEDVFEVVGYREGETNNTKEVTSAKNRERITRRILCAKHHQNTAVFNQLLLEKQSRVEQNKFQSLESEEE